METEVREGECSQDESVTGVKSTNSLMPLSMDWVKNMSVVGEMGAARAEKLYQDSKRNKILNYASGAVEEILEKAEDEPEHIGKVKKVSELLEEAVKSEVEQEELAKLWSGLIKGINIADPDYEDMLNITKDLSPSEAHFLLKFYKKRHSGVIGSFRRLFLPAYCKDNFDKNTNKLIDKDLLFKHCSFKSSSKILAIIILLAGTLFVDYSRFASIGFAQYLVDYLQMFSIGSIPLVLFTFCILALGWGLTLERVSLTSIARKLCHYALR